ncbi:hypothetical protein BH23THE1_BH23THE1_36510 [soil metagenome]
MDNYYDEDTEIKRKAENTSNETKDTFEEGGDKIKAGANAMGNKIKDPDKDLDTEYDKEKMKEDIT